MSAPPVVDARGVPDLRLWLMDQWRPGRTFHRLAAAGLANRGHLYGERREGAPARYARWELETLESATLWWVGAEMVDLLLAAAAGVPDDVVQYDLPIPAGAGLVVFEKPWWGMDADDMHGERIAVDAILWGTTRWEPRVVRGATDAASYPPGAPGVPWFTGLSCSSYWHLDFGEGMTGGELQVATVTGAIDHGKRTFAGHHVTDPDGRSGMVIDGTTEGGEMVEKGAKRGLAMARTRDDFRQGERAYAVTGHSWAPLGRSDWPVLHHLGDQPWQGQDMPPGALASFVEDRKVLAAFWTLIEQEGIASRREERPARTVARRTERAGVDPDLSTVQVILLRRSKRTVEEPADEHAKVQWSHRWLVEGFWRWQHVGPRGEGRRRLTYVRPHVRGPADKPLVVKQKVHAWTR